MTSDTRIKPDEIQSRLPALLASRLKESEYRVGFTGSRGEMTDVQHKSLHAALRALPSIVEAHHGDCIGADASFHALCEALRVPVYIHPPSDGTFRARCQNAFYVAPEKDFLVRNRDIVKATGILLAAPRSEQEVLRSGIWATIRFARKSAKTILLVLPDGTLSLSHLFSPG
jgi:hypothetical protein